MPRVFRYPDGWKNSFRMSVSEHTASTEVNLNENFVPFNEEGF